MPVRVTVLGNSGSGKSTLARAIAGATGAALLDLDTIAWEPGKIAVPRDEAMALADLEAFCAAHENWVIEGCYANLIAPAATHGAKLIFLNPGFVECIANCRARPFEAHKYASKEEQDRHLEFLLSWVLDYSERDGPLSLKGHGEAYEGWSGEKREIRARVAVDPFDPALLSWLYV